MPGTNDQTPKNSFRAAAITHYGEPFSELPNKIDYIAFAREICPTTQRVHYQTWAYASAKMRLTGWKKVFPGDHIEQMYGTFAQNDAYCSKESELISFGIKPMENGKKRSLQELCDAVVIAAETGTHLSEVVTEPEHRQPYVQYHNGIDKLYRHTITNKIRKMDPNFAPQVFYIWGPPGTYKTRYVFEKEPNVYKIPTADKYKWKDNYGGQDAVLYDNVTPDNIQASELLVEIDRYPGTQVSVKGGFSSWRPKRIYITSVYSIESFAINAGFSIPREFIRRVTDKVDIMDWIAQRADMLAAWEEEIAAVAAIML